MRKTFSEHLGALTDSVLEPVWTKIMSTSWPVRAASLLAVLGGATAWQFPDFAKSLVDAVNHTPATRQNGHPPSGPATDSAPNDTAGPPQPVAKTRQDIAALLGNEVLSANHSQQTGWSLAQTIVALSGLPGLKLADRDAIVAQIAASRHGKKFCWSELLHENEQPCVSFVTGWVLSALAQLDRGVKSEDLDYVLAQQSPGGAWPMFEGGGEIDSSTYTTCWMVLGLNDQLQRGLVPADRIEGVQSAVRRAALWLIGNQEQVAQWKAFPNMHKSQVSPSLSALAIHTLSIVQQGGVRPIYQAWLDGLPGGAAKLDNEEKTYLESGSFQGSRIDHFVQFRIPWMMMATADALPSGSPAQQAKGNAFIRGALANKAVSDAASDDRFWWHAELLIGLRYLEQKNLAL